MIKGLALTPPIVGRISIGKTVSKGSRRLPGQDDEFTITTQVQTANGWLLHPVDTQLRNGADDKLRSIPVRLLFDDPDLNLRAAYTLFDRGTGRPLCMGDGQTCRRATADGVKEESCPAPANCAIGGGGNCKPYGRLHVLIGQDDEVGTFVFRTTGFNSIRTLATRLRYLHALSGGVLSAMPLELRLRGKSTTMSHRRPIYYVDLTVAAEVTTDAAVAAARQFWDTRAASGFDQRALDDAARAGLALGEFADLEDEGVATVEEFYPEHAGLMGDGTDGVGNGAEVRDELAHNDKPAGHITATAQSPGIEDHLAGRGRRKPSLGARLAQKVAQGQQHSDGVTR